MSFKPIVRLHHVALPVTDLNQAHHFYGDLLGLKQLWRFILKADDAASVYGINQDCHFVTYGCGDEPCLELFSWPGLSVTHGAGHHFCLLVQDRDQLLKRLEKEPWPCRILEREGKSIVFISDPDGYLVELKPFQNELQGE